MKRSPRSTLNSSSAACPIPRCVLTSKAEGQHIRGYFQATDQTPLLHPPQSEVRAASCAALKSYDGLLLQRPDLVAKLLSLLAPSSSPTEHTCQAVSELLIAAGDIACLGPELKVAAIRALVLFMRRPPVCRLQASSPSPALIAEHLTAHTRINLHRRPGVRSRWPSFGWGSGARRNARRRMWNRTTSSSLTGCLPSCWTPAVPRTTSTKARCEVS